MSKSSLLQMAAARAPSQPQRINNIVGSSTVPTTTSGQSVPTTTQTLQAPTPSVYSNLLTKAPATQQPATTQAPAAVKTVGTSTGKVSQLGDFTKIAPVNLQNMASVTNAKPVDPNTAISDFTSTVGGAYGQTPWSQALQSSLNEYSKVWEQTKQQINSQFANTERSAAVGAASSGYSPFGAASADLSRQASATNARALTEANQGFGTNMSNLMNKYGDTLFNAIASDVQTKNQQSLYNADALNQMKRLQFQTQANKELSTQQYQQNLDLNKFNQSAENERINAQLESQPVAPGTLPGKQGEDLNTYLNELSAPNRHNLGVDVTGFGGGNGDWGYSYYDPETNSKQSVTVPKRILDTVYSTLFPKSSREKAGQIVPELYELLAGYYGTFKRASGKEPSVEEMAAYAESKGYKRGIG